MEKNFHAILQSALGKLDLVTREEFEVQKAVLAKTRSKLEDLEKTVAEIEQQLNK
jgi:BMFP domain-containing protein YqiC